MPGKLLIIDDDEKLLKLLTEYLGGYSYQVITAQTPERGLDLFRKQDPALVILDVMLPGEDGFSVLRKLRQMSSTPVIMLTARGDTMDRVVGLELGADDYLPKPFEPRELIARIQSILRRAGAAGSRQEMGVLHFEGLKIDVDSRRVFRSEKEIELTTVEFDILVVLATEPYKKFHRDQMIQALHGTDWAAVNRSIDVIVSRLRQKLGDDPKNPHYIKTVWGHGYVFAGKKTDDRT